MLGFSLATWRQSLFTRLTAGIGGLLALGFTTVQTILAAMPAASLPAVAPGLPIEAGRWRVALNDASLTIRPRPDGYAGPPGTKSLTLDLDILNRSSQSSNAISRIVTIDPPIAGLSAQPSFYLMRDGSMLGSLHPGLPERVRMIWAVPEQVALPPTLRVTVTAETFKPRDNLLAAPGWFNPKTVAAVTLPLRLADEGGAAAP